MPVVARQHIKRMRGGANSHLMLAGNDYYVVKFRNNPQHPRILVNELNTMPGFTETSVYAKLWEASGLPYPDLCDRLVQLAIERHTRARSYEF